MSENIFLFNAATLVLTVKGRISFLEDRYFYLYLEGRFSDLTQWPAVMTQEGRTRAPPHLQPCVHEKQGWPGQGWQGVYGAA